MSNNWYVITGGPCAGKSTLVKEFERKGHKVIHEVARDYIDHELAKGKTKEEIRKDEGAFQKGILLKKVAVEKKLDPKQLIFFDRGIADTTAYYIANNISRDNTLESALKNCSYKKVFVLELLDYKEDNARVESKELAKKIEELLVASYKELDIPVVYVPAMSMAERISLIEKEINNEQ